MLHTNFSHAPIAISSQEHSQSIWVRGTTALVTALVMGVAVLNPLIAASAKPYVVRHANSGYNFRNTNASYNSLMQGDSNRSEVFPGRYNQNSQNINQVSIPAGTSIPVVAEQSDSLTIAKGDSRSLTLNINANLRQANGTVLIPAGSQVTGQLQATEQGVQYIAEQVILPNGQTLPINATSRLLMNYQTQQQGASAADIIMGTLAGAGTATIIAGTTGDRHINALEVLSGAAVGALAGWGLPSAGIVGGSTQEVMTINPSQDLTLTLQSPLTFSNNVSSYSRYGDYSYSYR